MYRSEKKELLSRQALCFFPDYRKSHNICMAAEIFTEVMEDKGLYRVYDKLWSD